MKRFTILALMILASFFFTMHTIHANTETIQYKFSFIDGYRYNFSNGALVQDANFITTNRVRIINNQIKEVQNYYDVIIFFNNNNQYIIHYFHKDGFPLDQNDYFIIPNNATKFALMTHKYGVNALINVLGFTYNQIFTNPTFLNYVIPEPDLPPDTTLDDLLTPLVKTLPNQVLNSQFLNTDEWVSSGGSFTVNNNNIGTFITSLENSYVRQFVPNIEVGKFYIAEITMRSNRDDVYLTDEDTEASHYTNINEWQRLQILSDAIADDIPIYFILNFNNDPTTIEIKNALLVNLSWMFSQGYLYETSKIAWNSFISGFESDYAYINEDGYFQELNFISINENIFNLLEADYYIPLYWDAYYEIDRFEWYVDYGITNNNYQTYYNEYIYLQETYGTGISVQDFKLSILTYEKEIEEVIPPKPWVDAIDDFFTDNIPFFATAIGQVLISVLLMILSLIGLAVMGVNKIIILVILVIEYALFSLMGWMPLWITLIIVVVFTLLLFKKFKDGGVTVDD